MALRRRKIETIVRGLLENHKVEEAPVPVRQLAKSCGARLVYQGLESDLSGFLYREAQHSVIGVNTTHSQARQNFTIAHELGHLLLHQKEAVHYDKNFQIHLRSELSSQGTDEIEKEANYFAAVLLMPEEFLKSDLKKEVLRSGGMYFLDDDVISSLARKYGVSTQALLIRLKNLGCIED
jgi:Zn-dependent peptidase ImmA (M78 family)